jgi:hypothetical protein
VRKTNFGRRAKMPKILPGSQLMCVIFTLNEISENIQVSFCKETQKITKIQSLEILMFLQEDMSSIKIAAVQGRQEKRRGDTARIPQWVMFQ